MAEIALDAEALRRDRQRYADFQDHAEHQIEAWNARVDDLQQIIDGLDRLLVLAAEDLARDGGVPRGPAPSRGVGPASGGEAAPAEVTTAAAPPDDPARVAKPSPPSARAVAAEAPGPSATPAAPEAIRPPGADVPKGTDALRLVLESDPSRTWSLADLMDALGARGWQPTSRRPEEGVRISLKRLADRGGAIRTEDGRWRLNGAAPAEAAGPTPEPEPQPEPEPAPIVAMAAPTPAPPPSLTTYPSSFGRPVGGTITEL